MDKFDNSKPNIILLSDDTNERYMMKSFGVYKVARELRIAGYEVAVIHHAHIFSVEEILDILGSIVSKQTLYIGFNNTFYNPIGWSGSAHEYKASLLGSMLPHGPIYNQVIKNTVYQINPNCKFVLGGAAADNGECNKDFDYIVIGYSDISAVNLADHLYKGISLEKSKINKYGYIVINDAKAEDFDFCTRKMKYEEHDCIIPGETLFLEVARGCIFRCSFCSFPLNGKKKLDYIKHKELLVEELLENYNKYNVTRYLFLDDTFNDSKEKIELIYEISKELPFRLEFWAYIRLDLLTSRPETIDMIIDAGLRGCQFGIESLYPATQKAIGKGGKPEKQIETLRYIKSKYGDQVFLHASFIAGLPYEPKEKMIETYEFFLKEKDTLLDSAEVHPMAIEDLRDTEKQFYSIISKNPKSFGIELLSEKTYGVYYTDWFNGIMHFSEAQKIAKKYTQMFENEMNKIVPQDIFFLLSFGFDWSDFVEAKYASFNWDEVKRRKKVQTELYKNLIREKIIPNTEGVISNEMPNW